MPRQKQTAVKSSHGHATTSPRVTARKTIAAIPAFRRSPSSTPEYQESNQSFASSAASPSSSSSAQNIVRKADRKLPNRSLNAATSRAHPVAIKSHRPYPGSYKSPGKGKRPSDSAGKRSSQVEKRPSKKRRAPGILVLRDIRRLQVRLFSEIVFFPSILRIVFVKPCQ